MKYQHVSGREADQQRRILRDISYAKRHKDLQELHEHREKMRRGAEEMGKLNELRRVEGYLAHLQPGSRIRHVQNQPHLVEAKRKLLESIGLNQAPS